MAPKIDDRDREILKHREELYNAKPGPRVGDWLRLDNGEYRRFTYDWGHCDTEPGEDHGLQTTCVDGESGSFHLGGLTGDTRAEVDAYISYSGSLNPGVKRSAMVDTGETKLGRVWFFHHNFPGAGNGVEFEIPFRVFRMKPESTLLTIVRPTGISYVDKAREWGGDYLSVAFLPFSTLSLVWHQDVSPAMRAEIELDAGKLAARRGEEFEVSASGQTVTLGAK